MLFSQERVAEMSGLSLVSFSASGPELKYWWELSRLPHGLAGKNT
jgi:hypothetical protein